MKPSRIIILLSCLLAATLYLLSPSSSSSSSSIYLARRRSLRGIELNRSLPDHSRNINSKQKQQQQVVAEKGLQSAGEGFKYSRSNGNSKMEDEEEELAYHLDYHGVTTHPTPTPRHPMP